MSGSGTDGAPPHEPVIPFPDLWPFAAFLAQGFECTHVVDIGGKHAAQLAHLRPALDILTVSPVAPSEKASADPGGLEWRDRDSTGTDASSVSASVLRRSVVLCTGMLERWSEPAPLLTMLKQWLDDAPVCLIVVPEEMWGPEELGELLQARGFNVAFTGLTATDDREYETSTTLAVIERNGRPTEEFASAVPSAFRVVAVMCAYNEEDIIVPSIQRLIAQGVGVYLVDNWSTDRTHELAGDLLGRGLLGIERFPPDGPPPSYQWASLLGRVEELALEIGADWFMHHDADEVRVSPWPGVRLREALYAVGRAGYNSVDHAIIDFHPVDDAFMPGTDFGRHFRYFSGGWNHIHPHVKAWKSCGERVTLAESGGHSVTFSGRRTYPYKFLIKHYPIRSQRHGEKKVFRERVPRWDSMERARGWHVQYEHVAEGYRFLRSPDDLGLFDEDGFNRACLIARLSGIGLSRRPLPAGPEPR